MKAPGAFIHMIRDGLYIQNNETLHLLPQTESKKKQKKSSGYTGRFLLRGELKYNCLPTIYLTHLQGRPGQNCSRDGVIKQFLFCKFPIL